jgi:hypothetical protein
MDEKEFGKSICSVSGGCMPETLAIVHAPGASERLTPVLREKLTRHLYQLNIELTDPILVNPVFPISDLVLEGRFKNFVVGWGLEDEPKWQDWLNERDLAKYANQILLFDLCERKGQDGRRLLKPKVMAGPYWGEKTRLGYFDNFLAGHYLGTKVPYATRRVVKNGEERDGKEDQDRYTLEAGDPEEVKIVRLVFDLFVNNNYSRVHICQVLNGSGVNAPGHAKKWFVRTIGNILVDPVYIGACKYLDCIRHDVFPQLVSKSVFYLAQSRIMFERNKEP